MKTSTHLFRKTLSSLFLMSMLVCSVGALGCATTDLKRVRESEPVGSHQELQSRLSLPEGRVEAIVVGEEGKARLTEFFAGNAGQTGYECSVNACWCSGDADCNRMFTDVCRSPTTNGSCTGEPPICSCKVFV